MSAEKHTQGRLAVKYHKNTDGCTLHLEGRYWNAFAVADVCHTTQDKANARRLVACWNALLPFTIEQVEVGVDLAELVNQRDELLAALERARPHLCVGYSAIQRHEITKVVDSAIAKVKGSAT